jgi:hypothetical protein
LGDIQQNFPDADVQGQAKVSQWNAESIDGKMIGQKRSSDAAMQAGQARAAVAIEHVNALLSLHRGTGI